MAQNHCVDNTAEASNDCIGELLLDTLGLAEVDLFDVEHVLVVWVVEERGNLRVETVAISHKEHKFANGALQKLLGDSAADGARSTRQQHTLTFQLSFEIERWQVLLSLLFDLWHEGR